MLSIASKIKSLMSQKKILLTNSYAVNNGDMALVIALAEQLTKRGYSVSIATFYYLYLKEKYPQLHLIRELLDYRILNRFTFLKGLFLRINFFFNRNYRDHDWFISSPGGYVNSYYGLKRCLLPLVVAKKDQKKTAIYSQSIGPLNQRDRKLLTRFSKSIDAILVRDAYSVDCIQSITCYSQILKTKDAAFLLEPKVSIAAANTRKVAVSVREWAFDNRSGNAFGDLVIALCRIALNRGYEIEFISTCQGVPKYRDDSKVAAAFAHALVNENSTWKTRVSVNSQYFTVHQLQERLNSQYSFTIGTRLHMCILSMINGIPAFNISYEVKGIECYRYLGLEHCSIDYNEPIPTATISFQNFIEHLSEIRDTVQTKIKEVHKESVASLDEFLQRMETQA